MRRDRPDRVKCGAFVGANPATKMNYEMPQSARCRSCAPSLGLRGQVKLLREVLEDVQKKRFHEPNSDHYQYCNGCHRSPHQRPQHDDDCLVPRIARVLEQT